MQSGDARAVGPMRNADIQESITRDKLRQLELGGYSDIMLVPAQRGDVSNSLVDALAKAVLYANINEPESATIIRLIRL
eukprot:607829-Prymnesium_polylepis.1